jgi:hypothetical protein
MPTLDKWVREGALTPAIASRGTGEQRRFSVAQAFAVMVGRWLRHDAGKEMRTAQNAMDVLLCHSDESLERSFAEGRTHLLVVNGNVMPRLISRDAIESNPETAEMKQAADAAGIRLEIELIDVNRPHRQLMKWLRKNKPAKTEVTMALSTGRK